MIAGSMIHPVGKIDPVEKGQPPISPDRCTKVCTSLLGRVAVGLIYSSGISIPPQHLPSTLSRKDCGSIPTATIPPRFPRFSYNYKLMSQSRVLLVSGSIIRSRHPGL